MSAKVRNFNRLSVADVMRFLMKMEAQLTSYRGGSSHRLSYHFMALSTATAIEDARYGIERHLYYAKRNGSKASVAAINEIIKDAGQGVCLARENENEAHEARLKYGNAIPNTKFLTYSLMPARTNKKHETF